MSAGKCLKHNFGVALWRNTIGGTTLRVQEKFFNNGVVDVDWDTKLIFSQPILGVSKRGYGATFNAESGKTLTIKAGGVYYLNYAGMESSGITITAE